VDTVPRRIARWVLGAFLLFAGTAHLIRPEPFAAQVPPWFPAPGPTILVSGLVEIGLGAALLLVRRSRPRLGWVVAGFFVVIFPGNVSQFLTGTDAFGLDSDLARGVRLLFQPVLVAWALWSTGAWSRWRAARRARAVRRAADT
jgi:uncharacterized membrane protein